MQYPSIGFIGAGNMASALVLGLVRNGHPPEKIWVQDPAEPQIDRLRDMLNAAAVTGRINSGTEVNTCAQCDILVLAVKPQVLPNIARGLASILRQDALIVSVAAGIGIDQLRQWMNRKLIVRCMPNTPALIGAGATGMFAASEVGATHRQQVEQMFSAVGLVEWLRHEDDLDAVTAASGSGPAYFFLMIEAMIESATRLGLPRDQAVRLCIQTAVGAARLAAEDNNIEDLRRRVTSPGGTTERAIAAFEGGGLRSLVDKAMTDCAARSREMADGAKSL